jgi:hypothetical protein
VAVAKKESVSLEASLKKELQQIWGTVTGEDYDDEMEQS